jgi:hypothetical protein
MSADTVAEVKAEVVGCLCGANLCDPCRRRPLNPSRFWVEFRAGDVTKRVESGWTSRQHAEWMVNYYMSSGLLAGFVG